MKTLVLAFLCLFPVFGQQDRPFRLFPTDPVNPCSVITAPIDNWMSGNIWSCVGAAGVNNGQWALVSTAKFGSFIPSMDTYNFLAISPAGSLTASTPATLNLSACPLGVNGADVGHYLYLNGGGTSEAVLITGGTCMGNAMSGSISFTPANNHAAGYTLSSATQGLTEAVNALGPGGTVYCPNATHVMYGEAYVTPINVVIIGSRGCIFKANDHAQIKNMLVVDEAASGFQLSGTTWDGNRANGGSAQNGNDPTYALIALHASTPTISTSEIKNGNAVGILMDGTTVAPSGGNFTGNYIHDNGGVVDATGIGVGVRLGNSHAPDATSFTGNFFERNYNTVGSIHFANAINASGATNTVVTGNRFKDNLNTLGGGQVYLSNITADCSGEVSSTISGNTFEQTLVGVLDEESSGIELCGKGTTVVGNSVIGSTKYGIVIDGSVTSSVVSGNRVITTHNDGILIGGSNANIISSNVVTAPRGITFFDASTTFSTTVIGNDVHLSSVPVSGTLPAPDHFVYLLNNIGYNPVGGTTEVTVTSSPFSYQSANSPEQIYIPGGTITSVIKNGSMQPVCTSSPCTALMYPGETLVLTYSSGIGLHFYVNTM